MSPFHSNPPATVYSTGLSSFPIFLHCYSQPVVRHNAASPLLLGELLCLDPGDSRYRCVVYGTFLLWQHTAYVHLTVAEIISLVYGGNTVWTSRIGDISVKKKSISPVWSLDQGYLCGDMVIWYYQTPNPSPSLHYSLPPSSFHPSPGHSISPG